MIDDKKLHSRRVILGLIAGASLGGASPAGAQSQPAIHVWKDPDCGCCAAWVEHLSRNGFAATVTETADMQPLKAGFGVPADLASCHTGEIAGYVIEGHVPAAAILKLLAAKPKAIGLAVPGMPIGSPGMEGGAPEAYDVVLFGPDDRRTFGRYLGSEPA